jgi:hypothetical protein
MPETASPPEPTTAAEPAEKAERRGRPEPDKKTWVIAGALILGVIAILGVLSTFIEKGPREDTGVVKQQASSQAAENAPHIIPRPDEGKKPTDIGQRGGALQFILAGMLFGAVFAAGGYLWWTSTRRNTDKGRAARSLSRRAKTNG